MLDQWPEAGAVTTFEDGDYKVTHYRQGKGASPRAGDTVSYKYVTYIPHPKHAGKFLEAESNVVDEWYDFPVKAVVGVEALIPGWDQALMQMKEGGKAKVEIPARMGYGNYQFGEIPPNSDLVTFLTLVKVHP